MPNAGWIKLHRKLLDWEWYDDINTSRLFLHCLLRANHSDAKWRGVEIKRGSFITSLSHLANETGLTVQNIRTSLTKLKSTNELTSKTTNSNQVISMVHYDLYQETNTPANIPLTDEQQATNKLLTTDKNNKKNKELKNEKKDKTVANKFSTECIECSDFLENIIKTKKNIKPKTTTWKTEIDKLNRIDGVSWDRIIKALQWYQDNIGGQYVPVIESGKSLREKFIKLENAIGRGQSATALKKSTVESNDDVIKNFLNKNGE